MNMKTMACKICTMSTTFVATELCSGCWEVERNIDSYLKFNSGRLSILRYFSTDKTVTLNRELLKREYGEIASTESILFMKLEAQLFGLNNHAIKKKLKKDIVQSKLNFLSATQNLKDIKAKEGLA